MKFKALLLIIIISAIVLSYLPKSEQQLFHAVGGFVRDSDGNGINNVVVYIKNLDKNITKTAITQTGEQGKGAYTTLFLENEFDWGDTLYVEAKKGALYGNNSTVFIDTG
ncbi:MAG TPA: carboxypeptidase regulatory-like domain-containing protein, partial [Thermoplasmatales archaeon]|nr:carboxypeptidase regulatory-like domain-containing protein [Thermoplasmatales archaeon]